MPLGGRRVRGYVIERREGSGEGLKEVLGTSGDLGVFDRELLEVLRWAAVHYVAPMATVLGKAAPPNLPRRIPPAELPELEAAALGPLPELAEAGAAGRHARAGYWLGSGPWGDALAAAAAPILAADRSVMVVAPSRVEASRLAERLAERFGARVALASSGIGNAEVTEAWCRAATIPGILLVGTREVALWPVHSLGLGVMVEEGRRGMKDKATPTIHAREVLWRRSSVERFPLLLCGPVPTGEAVARGPTVTRAGESGRVWGLVEVVDRRDDPPGRGVVSERVRRALHAAVRDGRRVFVFTDRRSPATRCVRCRRLRMCGECGARPDRSPACPRCGAVLGACPHCGGERFEALGSGLGRVVAELTGVLGRDRVGEIGSGRPVLVGTERDLPMLGPVDLSVVVDADGLLRAPNYRALEDGLRLMARVVAAAGRGRGRRAMVQTADPQHPAIAALRRGDPMEAIEQDVAMRVDLGLPPGGELVVLEVSDASGDLDAELRAGLGGRAGIHGPAENEQRIRWLIQGRDLRAARIALRALVHDWRDRGVRVRVDADPIDL